VLCDLLLAYDKTKIIRYDDVQDGEPVEVEEEVPIVNDVCKAKFKSCIVDKLTYKNGEWLNEVFYHQKLNIGRHYGNDDGSLTTTTRIIRNTIYAYHGYVDVDMKAAHPSILLALALHYQLPCTYISEWVERKGLITQRLIAHHTKDPLLPIDEDHIKTLISSTLYGGGITGWCKIVKAGNKARNVLPVKNFCEDKHPWYIKFQAECKILFEFFTKNNKKLIEKVGTDGDTDHERKRTMMSYLLGALENECLYHAHAVARANNWIETGRLSLAYDGFTFVPPPNQEGNYDDALDILNTYVEQQTKLPVKFVVKGFDPKSVLTDVIEARRQIPDAQPAGIEAVVLTEQEEADEIAEDQSDGLDYDPKYLQWRWTFEKNHCKIINQSVYIKEVSEDGTIVWFDEAQMRKAYRHLSYEKEDSRGRTKRVRYIDEWFDDPNIRIYDRADAIPYPKPVPKHVYNTWRVSPYANKMIEEDDENWKAPELKRWLDHLRSLCGYDALAFDYVVNWFAQMIQFPAEKTTMLVFTGEEGSGKNILINTIKAILGRPCVLETTRPEEDVWGKFNSQMGTAFFVVLSEVDKRNSHNADGRIKALITDEVQMIECKGKDPYASASYHRLVILTNKEDPVKTHKKDRRTMILRTSDEFVGNFPHFESLVADFNSDGFKRTLYSYLKRKDLTGWNFRAIPRTEYHNTIIGFGRSPLDVFLEWWVGKHLGSTEVKKLGKEIYADFRAYKEEHGQGGYEIKDAAGLIKKLCLELKLPAGSISASQHNNKGEYRFYNIELLRKHYNLGCLIPVPTTDGGVEMHYQHPTGELEQDAEPSSAEASDHEDEVKNEMINEPVAEEKGIPMNVGGKTIWVAKRKGKE
jgi:hypothetical protein